MAWLGFFSTNFPNSYPAAGFEKRWSLAGIEPTTVELHQTFRTLYRLSYTAAEQYLLKTWFGFVWAKTTSFLWMDAKVLLTGLLPFARTAFDSSRITTYRKSSRNEFFFEPAQ